MITGIMLPFMETGGLSVTAILVLCLFSSVHYISASTDFNCQNLTGVCPGATVNLYCQTSTPILIWNVLGVQLDFSMDDDVGTTESSGGIVAELTGRSASGTQSKVHFVMNPSTDGHNITCYNGLQSTVSCQIYQIGYPGILQKFTCQSNGSYTILKWSEDEQGFYDITAFPNTQNCSILNYGNVTTSTLTLFKNDNCGYATYTIKHTNCLGEGEAATCLIEQVTSSLKTSATHAIQTKKDTALLLKPHETITAQTGYSHNEINTELVYSITTTIYDATESKTESLLQKHIVAATTTVQHIPTLKSTYPIIIVITGTCAVLTILGLLVSCLIVIALYLRKIYKPTTHSDANIQQLHHEEEWFNMTNNVVYECPIKLQDNSAYASINH